jgi:acyl-CoA thioester hydrolase
MDHEPTRVARVELAVPFHDVDLLQVVWHGHYIKYFEIARDQLFRDHGIDLIKVFERTQCLFPIVKMSAKHIFPLRYNDKFVCQAKLTEARRQLVVDFEVSLAADAKLCARGQTVQIGVRYPSMELQLEIPAEIRAAFGL